MAKKKAASKKTSKRTSKKASASKPAASKKTSKKSASKKTAAKKSTAKKSTAKKSTAKKSTAKKTTTKKAGTTKPASKSTAAKKTSSKKAAAGKSSSKKATESKPAAGSAPAQGKTDDAKAKNAKSKEAPKANDGKDKDGKPNRKGITIVENRSRKKKAESKFQPPPSTLGSLLAKRRRQPLIPSGPNAPVSEFSKFGEGADDGAKGRKVKSPFKKRELDKFREILLQKRRELAGDVEEMERGMSSLGDRGGDPALDVAEQGSDAYDQSLSIGLAEADRKLIREIDAALKRIDDGIYGVCEITHEPIGVERLKELPWTRLSIEAARDAERRGGGR